MGMFRSQKFVTGKGSYVELSSTGWTAPFTSYSISAETRDALDTTHTRSPGGYMEFAPGGFVNPGTIEINFHYDPENIPPIHAAEDLIRLVLVKPDSVESYVWSGPGFFTSAGGADIPEQGALATSAATIQKATGWTLQPAEPTEAL